MIAPQHPERAIATLTGLAIGDALGMPTQSLTREEVVKQFEPILTTFHAAKPDHPFAAGLAAATVTDDTEQTLLLARTILESPGEFNVAVYAQRLLEWEDDVRRRGLLDLLGPSTKLALENLQKGMDPKKAGAAGTTNGAAMRVAPVGIAHVCHDLERFVGYVVEVSSLTHNTPSALSGAAAVATVISAGIDGADIDGALERSLRAVALVEEGFGAANAMGPAIERAIHLGGVARGLDLIDEINRSIGTSLASLESIPAAFAVLVSSREDAWFACRVAASLGGDTDTIAAMTGAMGGSLWGLSAFPSWVVGEVARVNRLPLEHVALELVEARG